MTLEEKEPPVSPTPARSTPWRRTVVFLLALAMTPALGSAAHASAERLSAAELRSDAALLRRILETLHPGLSRYNTPASLDSAFGDLDVAFSVDRTAGEAFVAFSRLTSRLRCGHTFPSPFNQSDRFKEAWLHGPRLPFAFRWLGDRMIVTRALVDSLPLSPGTEILEMNGRPAADILARLMTVGRADGGNDAKRRSSLEVTAGSEYEAFDLYFPLLFDWNGEPLELLVRPPDAGPDQRHTIRPMSHEERLAVVRASAPNTSGAGPLWTLDWHSDDVALLRMPTWVTYNSSWNWTAWLDSTFAELARRKPRGLLIDLRGNEGGTTEVGTRLVRHLIAAPLTLEPVERRVRYRAVPADLNPYLDTWDPSFRDWGDAAVASAAGGYVLTPGGGATAPTVLEPVAPRFTGRVAVLVDASNSSATFQFAALVKRHGLATLVGEPTGGNQRGINGGALFFVRLPKSGIEVDLPLIGYFPPDERPDAGLLPDRIVTPTARDIARGLDPVLEAAALHVSPSEQPERR